MAETGSDTRSGIGARLRAGREKMGLTQLQASERLHVDPKVVEALEAERFDSLGATVFVRGHLKHYSELIGEQAAELLDLYAAATKPVLPDLTKLPKAAPESHPSRLAVPALIILIAFVAVGVVWWVVKSVGGPEAADKPKRGPQPVSIAATVEQDPAAVEGVGDEVAPAPNGAADGSAASGTRSAAAGPSARSGGAASPGAGVTSATGTGQRATPAAASVAAAAAAGTGQRTPPAAANGATQATGTGQRTPSAAANGATQATGTGQRTPSTAPNGATPAGAPTSTGATSTPAASNAAGSAAATTPATARSKPMEVTLRFAADSWVEVYDANGEKLFYDVGTAASSRTVSGTPPFRVTVANAPGVSLDVNGKPAAVPANALKGDEAHFTISRTGRIGRATPNADGG